MGRGVGETVRSLFWRSTRRGKKRKTDVASVKNCKAAKCERGEIPLPREGKSDFLDRLAEKDGDVVR